MLNRQWLSTFITLVEVGHFTRTAEHLHMTQPGVSQHIQKLEAQVGVNLLFRQGRQFELTAAGERLYHWARTLQQEERQLLASLSDDVPDEGACRIACSGALALQLYPLFLDHQVAFPKLQLSLEAAPNQRILAQLAAGEIELGLVSHADIPSAFSYQKLGEQPLQLVVPAAWQGDETSFEALNELGFIDHPDGAHYAERVLIHWGGFEGYERLARRGYINQISQILLPVAKGLGYTVLPAAAVTAFDHPALIRVVRQNTPVVEPVFQVHRRNHPLPSRYRWFSEHIQDRLRA